MSGQPSSSAPVNSNILADDRIYLCKDQFDDKSKELLTSATKSLGGHITTSPLDCTVVLTNPASLSYQSDLAALDVAEGAIHLPYHWLANCRFKDARLSLDDLPSPDPLFVHPSPEKEHFPVKTWVSINVSKRSSETPYTAQQHVVDAMETNGALIVGKRSQADVLVVDRSTKFYQTIKDEIANKGRTDQIVAEREWVDDCVRRRELGWKVGAAKGTRATQATEKEAERDSDQDSFVAEEPRPAGRGPGRPTGQPRVEYSPEDDDFLCRWLAQMGTDSFMSRKTYFTMVGEVDRYPIAARHSGQSWHERYKKNASSFSGRVQRYRRQGVDATLKTAEERAKAAAATRTPTRPVPVESSPIASGSKPAVEARRLPGSGSRSRLDARSAPPKPSTPAVAEASTSRSRNLVESDSESDSERPGVQLAPARIIPAVDVAAPEVDVVMEETVITETIPPIDEVTADQSFDDRIAIDEVLGESMSQSLQQSASTNASNGHDPAVGMAETQALLSDFARAKAAARAAATPPASPRRRRREDVEPDAARSPRRRAAPPSPYATGALRSPTRPSTNLRPAAEAFALRSPDRGVGHRTSMPAVVHVEVQAIEVGGNLIDIQAGGGTPKRKSLLQRELETSTARRAARSSKGHTHSPDRVYASTHLPPARSSNAPSSSPAPEADRDRRRARSPPISRAEHERRVSQGAEVAEAYRNEYKTNMVRLSRTYGLVPRELGRLMAEFRKRGVTGWPGIEAELARMRRTASEFDDDV